MAHAFLLLSSLSCTDATAPNLRDEPDISAAVTGAALAALGGDGRFVLFPDIPAGPEGVPLISGERARELATAFTQSYGPAFVSLWEADRRAAIQLDALVPSARVYPAISAFAAVPDIGCHPADVRMFGSFYLLTLDAAGEQQVRMAVSAQLADYGIDANGDIDEPSRTGHDFLHEGVRADRSVAFLVSAEQAVDLTHRWTGARTREMPRLVMRWTYTPNFGLWRLQLDREVPVLRDGRIERVRTLFVGPNARERFFIASAQQPATVPWICSLIDENLVDTGTANFDVATTAEIPLIFEPVTPLQK